MPLLKLHQHNNPTELELIDSMDISTVDTLNGATVITMHSGVNKFVKESPTEISELLGG